MISIPVTILGLTFSLFSMYVGKTLSKVFIASKTVFNKTFKTFVTSMTVKDFVMKSAICTLKRETHIDVLTSKQRVAEFKTRCYNEYQLIVKDTPNITITERHGTWKYDRACAHLPLFSQNVALLFHKYQKKEISQ